MTFGELGWVDAIGFGFGLLLEVPSGAIADLLGKRKTILIGMIFGALGVFIITFSGSLIGIFIGWMMTQLCYAFHSGAAEAIAYDSLVDLGEEDQFDKVISKSSEIGNYAGATTILFGGLLFSVSFWLPHFLWGLSFIFGAIIAWMMVEPKAEKEKFSAKNYFAQLSVGVKELTQTGLRKYIGFFFVLVGVFYMYGWSFIRPATASGFGFFATEQGIILPILILMGAFAVRKIPYLKTKISDLTGLLILSGMMAAGFVLASFPIGYFGIIAMILIDLAGGLASPWISIIVNKRIDSKYRATTLSTVALVTKIPYVLIAVAAGKIVQEGKLPQFNLTVGLIVLVVAIISGGLIKFSGNRLVRS